MKSLYKTKLALLVALSLVAFGGCGGPSTSVPAQGTNNAAQASSGVLLDTAGSLDGNDMHIGNNFADRYQVNVQAGDHLIVDVTSTAFDTTLEVTPPSGGSLVNDDWQGDRAHSRIEFVATAAGELKIQVSSYTPQTAGAYHVSVQRAAAGAAMGQAPAGTSAAVLPGVFLSPGGHANGELAQGDTVAPDGTFFDQIFVNSPGNEALTLRVVSPTNSQLRTFVTNSRGQAILPSSPGVFTLQGSQLHRVQIVGSAPGQGGQWAASVDEGTQVAQQAVAPNSGDHQIPTDLGTVAPIQLGQEIRGTLAASDTHMQTGEFADVYEFQGRAGTTVNFAINSDAFDTYLLVAAPSGQISDNDDSGGTRNSALSLELPHDGMYRVFVTSYRPGETGAYVLKVLPDQRTSQITRGTPSGGQQPQVGSATAGATQTMTGSLAQGDRTLQSGEFTDEYTFNLTAGSTVHIGATSSEFDTYLIVQPPAGEAQQNDDLSPENRNAGIDLQVSQTGPYRVVVTSYRPGETGAYELRVDGAAGGAAAPAAASPASNTAVAEPTTSGTGGFRTITGSLAQGDGTLQSGEFRDEYPITLPAGAHVNLRVHSTAFDTYLIVFPPQGAQSDNDDAAQGNTDSALDLVTTVAGNYRVVVTSYRAGETGAYELTIGAPGAQGSLPAATTPATPNEATPAQPAATGPSTAVAPGARQTRGNLARGDQTLQSGEFVDRFTMHFDAGSSVRLRLNSSAFDTYLLVRTPSGRQLDNDDLTPSDRNSGIDIPLAEAGDYEISVTSYRAGETGAYVLTQERGPSIPGAAPASGQAASGNASGGRLYGIFAGISDYPGTQNDLPECANDAVKMSQTLTQAGLLDDAHQVLLTDAEATPDALRQAFQRFAGQMRQEDIFIFFYSGHGGRNAGSQDAREIDGTDETIFLYNGEIVDNEMGQMFDSLHAGTSILSLDSCYSGGFAKDVITRTGRVGLFSSEEDVTSGVAQQFQAGGYLSYLLRTALAGEADGDPHDRVLTVGELTHFVYRQFGQHVTDVRMGAAYQQLVVDRGAVSPETVLWAYRQ
ncbi:MAG: pre-peptidase C-terminal domain-containing protein [Sandaracinaceae bacterium]|nr:pre-peptidase C-terminal domain-containing protein [Sandaracinaceae bacterium]